jgi:hypothetical protein
MGVDRRLVADVGPHRQGGRTAVGGDGTGPVQVDVGDQNGEAVRREPAGAGGADTGAAPGDEGGLHQAVQRSGRRSIDSCPPRSV